MKNITKLVSAIILGFFIGTLGCTSQSFRLKPVFFNKTKKVQADSSYYERKAVSLVKQIYIDSREFEITRVAVMDLVDMKGNMPVFGTFLSYKISHVMTQGHYFTIVQRGELQSTAARVQVGWYDEFDTASVARLGNLLDVDAIIVGSIIDIGTGFDVNLMSIDVKTGDVIASASEEIARTKYAVDLMESF